MASKRKKTALRHAPRTLLATSLLALAVGTGACFNSNQPSAAQVTGIGQNVLTLNSLEWGRIVDVLDLAGVLVEADALIRSNVQTDGINYVLSTNPVTEAETLQVLQLNGSAGFADLLAAAKVGLASIATRGPLDPPPFDVLPRNAGLLLKFSELVDPLTVDNNTIQVWVGDPPLLRLSVRFIVKNDPISGKGCILLDPTISSRQSPLLGIPQNAVGFPAALDTLNDNVVIRIPTEIETTFGQPVVLTNQAGTRELSPSPTDPTQPSLGGAPMVVRSFRSGNPADPSNGFLEDLRRPNLVTELQSSITNVTDVGGQREITYFLNAINCQDLAPKVGDLHEVGTGVLLINAVINSGNPLGLIVRGVLLEGDIAPGNYVGNPLVGRTTTRYSGADSDLQGCYLNISPPLDINNIPALNSDPNASISVTFDEPIDGSTVVSMHSMVLTEYNPGAGAGDDDEAYQASGPESVGTYIDRLYGYMQDGSGGLLFFGPVEVSNGNRTFTLTPAAGLSDSNGGGFDLALALRDGFDGIRDLAGNTLNFSSFVAGSPGQDPNTFITVLGGPLDNKYFVLRALSLDENGDGLSEYAGQISPGSQPGTITGRSLMRFSRQADPSNQWVGSGGIVPAATTPFDPLTPAGSVAMTAYRPHDLGFGYADINEFNLDLEGFNWAPTGGLVFDDFFARFSLAFAHCNRMPDEQLTPNGLPAFPLTGLRNGGENFDDNILGFPTFDEKIVFDSAYEIRAINLFSAASLTTMLPMPGFTTTYTWRDTTIPQSFTGAPNGVGSPPFPYAVQTPPLIWATPPYGGTLEEPAPSIGLPLLVRFRCYPLGERLGVNRFQTSTLIPTSALPAFRVFSAGGRDGSGIWNLVIPDNLASGGTAPTGGFSVTGAPTRNHDPSVYWSQSDFVVRVSRVYTHWFSFGGQLSTVEGINLEPDLINQPLGTNVIIEYRGSVDVSDTPQNAGNDPGPLKDASAPFDDYGDFLPNSSGSVAQPTDWTTDLSSLAGQGLQYFQLRITFVANIQQNLEAVLDAFGLAWANS